MVYEQILEFLNLGMNSVIFLQVYENSEHSLPKGIDYIGVITALLMKNSVA